MNWQQLTIEIDGMDCSRLLLPWRWLVPESLEPLSLTLFGDWFLEDSDGAIFFLDTLGGRLSQIAPSRASFLAEREKPENLDEWYMPELALFCWERGLFPKSGECLTFKFPPVLGGSIEFDNVQVCPLMVHETIAAELYRQVKDLPEGAVITKFTVDREEP